MGYSVLNQKLYEKIQNGTVGVNTYGTNLGYNLIKITPNILKWAWGNELTDQDKRDRMYQVMSAPMVGLMTNEFTYSLSSNWEAMEYPALLNLGTLSDFAAFRGGGEFGAVFKSKKVWKKSGDLTLSPEIRIIDVNGDGLPLRVARQIIMWSTSLGSQSIFGEGGERATQDLINSAEGALTSLSNTIKTSTSKLAYKLNPKDNNDSAEEGSTPWDMTGLINTFGNIAGIGVEGVKRLIEDIDDYSKLKFSPPPLRVQIGRIFDHNDMVLTNVEYNFSRESTSSGPLYVDIRLTLVTRKIVSDLNDTGLYRAVDTPGAGNIVISGGAGGQTGEVAQEDTPDNNFKEEGEQTGWITDLFNRKSARGSAYMSSVEAAGRAGYGPATPIFRM